MSAQKKPPEKIRRLLEENVQLRAELDALKTENEEIRMKYTKVKATNKKRNDWNNELSYRCTTYLRFIEAEIGRAPFVDSDYMTQLESGTLSFNRRPHSHFAPQILIPDRFYTSQRICLNCGQLTLHKGAWGKCPFCPHGARYCSELCQKANWPWCKFDHRAAGNTPMSHET